MNISASQISSNITSISNSNSTTRSLFQNRNMFTGESIEDNVDISDQGMMISKMMYRMKSIDPSQMAEKMDGVKDKIDGLGLKNLDVDNMSREELESKMSEIHEIMQTMRPEGVEGRELNFGDMSDDELKSMITRFSDKSQMMQGGMSRLKEMGGMMNMMGQSGISSMQMMTDGTQEIDLVDMLLSALESEDEDDSYFSQTIADYLSNGTLSIF